MWACVNRIFSSVSVSCRRTCSIRSKSPPGSTTAARAVFSHQITLQFCMNGVTGTTTTRMLLGWIRQIARDAADQDHAQRLLDRQFARFQVVARNEQRVTAELIAERKIYRDQVTIPIAAQLRMHDFRGHETDQPGATDFPQHHTLQIAPLARCGQKSREILECAENGFDERDSRQQLFAQAN